MARQPNTNVRGGRFDQQTVEAVWRKAPVVPGYDPETVRYDACGSKVILYIQYGNTSSEYGWEIDHINPVSNGGGDGLENLQPLYWKRNREKGDTFPWGCP